MRPVDKKPMYPPLVGSTFMKSDPADISELGPNHIAVVGIPYEGTKVSRLGCKHGPTAIREATFMFSYLLQSLAGAALVDPVTEEIISESDRYEVVDVGDLGVFQADVHETSRIIRENIAQIVSAGAFPLILGGDHYTSFPSLQGVLQGLKAAGRNERFGYAHIDAHLDLADEMPFFGKLSSGTQVRRMIDTAGVDPTKMLMIGIGGIQPKAEWDFAKSAGINLVLRHELLAARSIHALVSERLSCLADCTAVYLTIDIDVNDRTFAPGVGNAVGAGGIVPLQFLEILSALRALPLVAVDFPGMEGITLSPDLAKALPSTPEDRARLTSLDDATIAKSKAEWIKRWDREIVPLIGQ
jgi:agmatinase